MSKDIKQGKKKAANRHQQIQKDLLTLSQNFDGYEQIAKIQVRQGSNTSSVEVVKAKIQAIVMEIKALLASRTKFEVYLGV